MSSCSRVWPRPAPPWRRRSGVASSASAPSWRACLRRFSMGMRSWSASPAWPRRCWSPPSPRPWTRFSRIQFTPDLMPATSPARRSSRRTAHRHASFRFVRGPIFANLVLADEINRTPPKTQAALLQAMQERQVTAAGETLPAGPTLPRPRHPEPHRAGRHLSPARGPARPLHAGGAHRLPLRGRRSRGLETTGKQAEVTPYWTRMSCRTWCAACAGPHPHPSWRTRCAARATRPGREAPALTLAGSGGEPVPGPASTWCWAPARAPPWTARGGPGPGRPGRRARRAGPPRVAELPGRGGWPECEDLVAELIEPAGNGRRPE